MNFKHIAIKTLCTRLRIDLEATPRVLKYEDLSNNIIKEGYIDIIRLTRNVDSFTVNFIFNNKNVDVTMAFDKRIDTRPFGHYITGTVVQVLSMKASDPNILSDDRMREVMDEILATVSSTINVENKGLS